MKPGLLAGMTHTRRFVVDLAKQRERLEAKAAKLAQLKQS